MGPLEVTEETRKELIAHAESEGSIPQDGVDADFSRRVADMLSLIAATREYQFG